MSQFGNLGREPRSVLKNSLYVLCEGVMFLGMLYRCEDLDENVNILLKNVPIVKNYLQFE